MAPPLTPPLPPGWCSTVLAYYKLKVSKCDSLKPILRKTCLYTMLCIPGQSFGASSRQRCIRFLAFWLYWTKAIDCTSLVMELVQYIDLNTEHDAPHNPFTHTHTHTHTHAVLPSRPGWQAQTAWPCRQRPSRFSLPSASSTSLPPSLAAGLS